ncbi:MAG TPA: 23S rRNA (pseudouridine(1915)-N(3))-methyltransferase RlmH [Caulobacteraceae bacterium]|nr:23S rRNA (pseudouridine(1915)-N(3))-methyltransferase RlmH [Caulobacteraceae bacterium]
MRISLICVGRLGPAPEAALARAYAERASAAGRALGLAPVEIVEVEARKPGKAAEAEAILAKAEGARLIACDERGKSFASRDFATRLAALRDDGLRQLAFAIGGADGLDPAVREAAADVLSFGPQTWPHALARVMLAEQVYRAVAILAGAPYHRD